MYQLCMCSHGCHCIHVSLYVCAKRSVWIAQVVYNLVVVLFIGFTVPAMVNLRSEVDDTNMSSLELLPLGGDGAKAVRHFITFLGHVLPLDAAGMERREAKVTGFVEVKEDEEKRD